MISTGITELSPGKHQRYLQASLGASLGMWLVMLWLAPIKLIAILLVVLIAAIVVTASVPLIVQAMQKNDYRGDERRGAVR
ncbi:MAG: hypothetical protein V3U76_12860 [Granulosicoccus sp.]